MAAMVLLGISTFCTDDGRIIFFNKLGIFLLMMSLLLKQCFDTSKWGLGKGMLSALFIGVLINIFKAGFPLFRYSAAVVTVLYLALSFAHPDYIIARVNVANTAMTGGGAESGARPGRRIMIIGI